MHTAHCAQCTLYKVHTIHSAHTAQCTLYIVLTVHTVHSVQYKAWPLSSPSLKPSQPSAAGWPSRDDDKNNHHAHYDGNNISKVRPNTTESCKEPMIMIIYMIIVIINNHNDGNEGETKHGGELRGALPRSLCCRPVEPVEPLQRCKIVTTSTIIIYLMIIDMIIIIMIISIISHFVVGQWSQWSPCKDVTSSSPPSWSWSSSSLKWFSSSSLSSVSGQFRAGVSMV